jgi:hypothetical protein
MIDDPRTFLAVFLVEEQTCLENLEGLLGLINIAQERV